MTNRTAAVIITIVVVLLCAFPGIAFVCNGFLALIEVITNYRVFNLYGYNAPYWTVASFCIGLLGILIAIVVAYLVLRQKKTAPLPPPPVTPLSPPDEPLPPTI
jgi:uncharacterized membrane protein YccC